MVDGTTIESTGFNPVVVNPRGMSQATKIVLGTIGVFGLLALVFIANIALA